MDMGSLRRIQSEPASLVSSPLVRRRSIGAIPACVSHTQLETILAEVSQDLEPQAPRRSFSVAYSSPKKKSDNNWTTPPSSPVRHAPSPVSPRPSPFSPSLLLPRREREQNASLLVVLVPAGCLIASGLATNVAFEMLSRSEPGCSTMLTFCQYIVALLGGIRRVPEHLSTPAIPLRVHLLFCFLMTCTAYCGNASVEYDLPFPLYLIIKSSNLVASMLVGKAFGKRYSRGQCLAVIAMTAGVITSTLSARSGGSSAGASTGAGLVTTERLAGATLCAVSTLSMALLGAAQESAFATYGQQHEEVIFYMHLLGLAPLFWLQHESPFLRLRRWLADGKARVWLLVILNLIACQGCKRAFFALLGATSSLSASLGVLSYRFLGILLSAFLFNAPPPPPASMLFGVALVTVGGLAYLSQSASTQSSDARDSPDAPRTPTSAKPKND